MPIVQRCRFDPDREPPFFFCKPADAVVPVAAGETLALPYPAQTDNYHATFGVMLGIVIGALPGLTATMGVAILLPFTYGMEPVSGLLMICGVFFGGVYGGSITAILLKIPGTPAVDRFYAPALPTAGSPF